MWLVQCGSGILAAGFSFQKYMLVEACESTKHDGGLEQAYQMEAQMGMT